MSNVNDLFFELGCEELPPMSLMTLRDNLVKGICTGLDDANLQYGTVHRYATPRRLAVWIENVQTAQEDINVEKRGPAITAAYDKDGNPSKAALGFARGCGADFSDLGTLKTDKGEWLSYNTVEKGQATEQLIPNIIETSLNRLPIAKRMRWGNSDAAFVRPVHWAVLLFGESIIEANILGLTTGNTSYGHRFHAPDAITITDIKAYESQLQSAHVIACAEQRRAMIEEQAHQAASAVNGVAHIDASLLDEITALVEFPVAVTGSFDDHFLELPKEVLITTMQINQKYFPVLNADNALLPYFITMSNIQSSNVSSVSHGNERVIRPRLADAEFFWQQDLKQTLASRIPLLNNVVFQHKLGSIGEKTQRVSTLTKTLAETLRYDAALATRAAQLAKTDLVTDMVGEFASLQGTIGRYYAQQNGEPTDVALAIEEQYLPKQSGGRLPASHTGTVLALADKLDTLVGIFSVGLVPTGDKDPFALRRASLGILRLIIENNLSLDLKQLIDATCANFTHTFDANETKSLVFNFMIERLKGYAINQGFSNEQFVAVSSVGCSEPVDFMNRLNAVKMFALMDEAANLSEANKRIQNLLKKAPDGIADKLDKTLLVDPHEIELYTQLQKVNDDISPFIKQHNYIEALKQLSALNAPIDRFFEHVFIMADDEKLKLSRLGLLANIRGSFIKIADISMI